MKTNDQGRLLRQIKKWEPRSPEEIQNAHNFQEYMLRRKKKVEILQRESVANQIYIFPRKCSSSNSSFMSQNLEGIEDQSIEYHLNLQNKCNKSNQHSSYTCLKADTPFKIKPQERSESKLSHSLRRPDKKSKHKDGSGKRKQKNQQRTLLNSSKRLIIAEQYSLGTHPNNANTKKGSQNATLACQSKPTKLNKVRQKTQI